MSLWRLRGELRPPCPLPGGRPHHGGTGRPLWPGRTLQVNLLCGLGHRCRGHARATWGAMWAQGPSRVPPREGGHDLWATTQGKAAGGLRFVPGWFSKDPELRGVGSRTPSCGEWGAEAWLPPQDTPGLFQHGLRTPRAAAATGLCRRDRLRRGSRITQGGLTLNSRNPAKFSTMNIFLRKWKAFPNPTQQSLDSGDGHCTDTSPPLPLEFNMSRTTPGSILRGVPGYPATRAQAPPLGQDTTPAAPGTCRPCSPSQPESSCVNLRPRVQNWSPASRQPTFLDTRIGASSMGQSGGSPQLLHGATWTHGDPHLASGTHHGDWSLLGCCTHWPKSHASSSYICRAAGWQPGCQVWPPLPAFQAGLPV